MVGVVELAVDAEADAHTGDEERGHTAERRVQHAEREERRELGAVRVRRVRVAAEEVDAVRRVLDLEHAQVFDARQRRLQRELRQAAGKAERAEVGGDGEAVDIDLPRAGVEERARDVVPEPQVLHRCGETEQRDVAVEIEADHLELAGREVLLVGDAEADLLEVDRAERALDRQVPRPVAAARPQRDLHALAVTLDGERGAERGPWRRPAATGVGHDALRDGVVAAAVAQRHGETGEFDFDATGEVGQVAAVHDHAAEQVHGDAVHAQARVDQRAAGLADAQAERRRP